MLQLNIKVSFIVKIYKRAYENSQYHSTTKTKPKEADQPQSTNNPVRASTRFASSINVVQNTKPLLTGDKEKTKDKLLQPLDEIKEMDESNKNKDKEQFPSNMQSNMLNNKVISLNDKESLTKEKEMNQVPASKRFSTKEVFKIRDALNKKK